MRKAITRYDVDILLQKLGVGLGEMGGGRNGWKALLKATEDSNAVQRHAVLVSQTSGHPIATVDDFVALL